jgi:type IV pilus assembly protein PilW
MRIHTLPASRPAQRGFSLIEIMVGILIALLAILVIFQVFAVAEGLKRNTTGAADAQQNGLLSVFTLGLELANAGNGIATAGDELGRCDPAAAINKDIKTTLRPIPVLITDNSGSTGGVLNSDSFVVNYSTATRVVAPAKFQGAGTWAIGSTSFTVVSPNGYKKDDLIVGIANPEVAATGCSLMKISSVTVDTGTGVATLTTATGSTVAFTTSSQMFNMGQSGQTQRVLYDLDTTARVLRSTDLLTTGATANPLASNVMLVKARYGIDTDNDDIIDSWVRGEGDWAPDKVLAMPMYPPTPTSTALALSRIKAVRIGVVVRSEQYDRDVTGAYSWRLFECAVGDTTCQGSLPANWRYRTYETIIPLRNQIWNPPV